MKRFLALAALVLGLASCQTEPEGLGVNVGGEVDTTITVTIPDTETRYGSDSNSALGVFDNGILDAENVTMRYILQVFQGVEANGTTTWKASKETKFEYSDERETITFDVRLVPGRDYKFVVWADVVTSGENDTDNHYNTHNGENGVTDLTKVTLNGAWDAMDESRDAFTGVELVEDYSGSSTINFQLTRPFAKLRVKTIDVQALTNLGIQAPFYATVVYTTPYRAGFNALTETAIEANENDKKTHNVFEIASYDDNNEREMVLFTDYLFANEANDDEVNFILSVYEDQTKAKLIKSNPFTTPIPARRNYLTTIQGNILTDGNNITVEVKDAFENGSTWNPNGDKYDVEIVEVGNAADLQQVIEEAQVPTTIVLSGNIDLGGLFGASTQSTRATAAPLPIVVAEGKSLVLELNGYKITTPWDDEAAQKHYYAFDNKGSLTIKDSNSNGNGEIVARGIYNYGTLTLESGKIDACDGNGGYAVYNQDGSTFVMNGGMITTSLEDDHQVDNGGYDATTLRLEPGATAIINGGTIDNICDYTYAIDNYGEVTVNGGTFTSIHSTVSSYGTMTINGGSFIRNGLVGVSAHALIVWNGSNTTINGGTFDGQVNNNGYNVYADEGAVVEINDGNFLKAYIASLYGKGTINVKGGTFFDDPSARVVKGYVAEKNGDVFVVSKIALAENFADNSWDKIILACQNNIVPESWNVGDKKAMPINGKDYQIRIIGKNHDTYTAGGKAPLTFQIAEVYGTAPMNATQTNTTGWSGSLMRTESMANILEVMPVKDAIKAVNKETLNGTRDGLETTSDKLFLLSEIEVNGSVFFSNNFEEGSRYAFYTGLDSKIMNASYWLRGPGKNNAIGFTQINGSGYMANGSAEYDCGVVFGFCF